MIKKQDAERFRKLLQEFRKKTAGSLGHLEKDSLNLSQRDASGETRSPSRRGLFRWSTPFMRSFRHGATGRGVPSKRPFRNSVGTPGPSSTPRWSRPSFGLLRRTAVPARLPKYRLQLPPGFPKIRCPQAGGTILTPGPIWVFCRGRVNFIRFRPAF